LKTFWSFDTNTIERQYLPLRARKSLSNLGIEVHSCPGGTLANPPALGARSDSSLINVGSEAATIYALALESAGPGGATPAARS
jgi:hypothetical protein